MAKAGIVYVGTTNGLAMYSDPGGKGNWRRRWQTLEGRRVLAILAVDEQTLIAAPEGEAPLFSADGGQSWVPAAGEDARRLQELLEAEGSVVYTAQGPARWRGEQLPATAAVALALLAGKEEVLLAAVAEGASLVRSVDGGATWEPAVVLGTLQGNVTTIVPASYHMDFAWAGTDQGQLLRSDDRGRTWQEIAVEQAPVRSLAVVRLESAS